MQLDDIATLQKLDPQHMIDEIRGLPDQLEKAWTLGGGCTLPVSQGIQRVAIAGMGGSAIGADLLAAYIAPICRVPVAVVREYDLPAWAAGSETLFIASSHSGNTEETLSAFNQAKERGCRIVSLSTGGELEKMTVAVNAPLWKFEHHGQPRAAVGYSFGLLLSLFTHLNLIPDQTNALSATAASMRKLQTAYQPEVPTARNPAKRQAGQLVDRWVTVVGSGYFAPVARRWKGQLNELAKAWGQFEFLPEADHNTAAGVVNPSDALSKTVVLFLQSSLDHPRNQRRSTLTREAFMVEGLNTNFYQAVGETPLEQIFTTLHFGDYMAYYLAMAYGVDPTPVPAIEGLKVALKK